MRHEMVIVRCACRTARHMRGQCSCGDLTPWETDVDAVWDACDRHQREQECPGAAPPVKNGGEGLPPPPPPPMTGPVKNGGEGPICPRHQKPMAVSRFGGWYCTHRDAAQANGYCQEQVKGPAE